MALSGSHKGLFAGIMFIVIGILWLADIFGFNIFDIRVHYPLVILLLGLRELLIIIQNDKGLKQL